MQIDTSVTPDIYNLQPGDMFTNDDSIIVVVKPPHADQYHPEIVQVFAYYNGERLYALPDQFIALVASLGAKAAGRVRLA